MDATQILMMPLVGAVPATASDSTGMALTEQPLAEQFSQLLDDVLKGTGAIVNPAPELFSDNQESVSSPQPETSVLPATDTALQQMMASFVPVLQPVQPQLQAEAPQELLSSPVVSAMEASVVAQTVQSKAQVVQPKVEAQVEQPKVEAQVEQPKVEAQVEQPKVEAQVVQPKVEAQVEQPKVEAQVVQPKVEAQVEQPKVEARVVQPKVEAQVVQPQVEAQVVQPQVEAQVVQPKVEAQVVQPKVEAQVVQPKVEAQVVQPQVEAQVVQPKVEAQVVQPKVEAQVVQPKVEAQVEQPKVAAQVEQPKVEAPVVQAHPQQTTEWWSYGRPAAVQQVAGLQVAANPDQNKNAVVIEKPTHAELLQTGSAQAAVTAPVAGDALSMEMGTDGNAQGRAFSEGMVQQHSLSVSTMNQRSEGMIAEKSAENLRSTLPEQVSRQVTERLSTHDFRQGKESLSLTLTPEHLGKIQMNFQMDQQNLRVEIVAENRVAREALMQQVDSLKESLARQNVTVEKFEVTTNSGKEFQQQYQPQQQQQQQLYSSLYDRHGANTTTASNLSEGGDEYQLPEGMQYFAPQYESTFTYRA